MARSIAVKALGALNLPDACDRCFWLQHYGKAPWERFPGIFSTLSSIQLKGAKLRLEQEILEDPGLLTHPDRAAHWVKPPDWRKFSVKVGEIQGEDLLYRGMPDWVCAYPDGAWHIEDFKTARHTNDEYLGQYVAQLNGYAWIAQQLGTQVRSLALRYNEPLGEVVSFEGYRVPVWFQAEWVPVALDPSLIPVLLKRALDLISGSCPMYASGLCEDCDRLEFLAALSRKEIDP